jgi:hypothetical protein
MNSRGLRSVIFKMFVGILKDLKQFIFRPLGREGHLSVMAVVEHPQAGFEQSFKNMSKVSVLPKLQLYHHILCVQ